MCAGLALCSKYSAVLTIIGATGFLLTEPRSRRWLARPQPYAAGLVALVIFLPVLSGMPKTAGSLSCFRQAGRRALPPIRADSNSGRRGRVPAPLDMGPFGGVRLYCAPARAVDRERWLPVCLAAPPLIVFAAASLRGNALFHWAAPGYLMLLPLLGDAVARHWRTSRAVRVWLASTAGFVLLGSSLFASEARFAWLPAVIGDFRLGEGFEPRRRRLDLDQRRFSPRSGASSTGQIWSSPRSDGGTPGSSTTPWVAGRRSSASARMLINTASSPAGAGATAGADVLIVTRAPFEKILGQYWFLFDTIEPLGPATVLHAGRPALRLNLFLGHRLHKAAEECCIPQALFTK